MEKINAKDKECIICGKQANVFWPVIDPDIEAHPYCKECVKEEKLKLLVALYSANEKEIENE